MANDALYPPMYPTPSVDNVCKSPNHIHTVNEKVIVVEFTLTPIRHIPTNSRAKKEKNLRQTSRRVLKLGRVSLVWGVCVGGRRPEFTSRKCVRIEGGVPLVN